MIDELVSMGLNCIIAPKALYTTCFIFVFNAIFNMRINFDANATREMFRTVIPTKLIGLAIQEWCLKFELNQPKWCLYRSIPNDSVSINRLFI